MSYEFVMVEILYKVGSSLYVYFLLLCSAYIISRLTGKSTLPKLDLDVHELQYINIYRVHSQIDNFAL